MTLPPTDSGGPGHRPPDSTEDERHQRIPGVARAPTNATTPSIPQGASGGPHQGTTISSAGPDPFPALVTTPSDARGRKGTAAAGIGLAQRQQDGTGLQSDAAEPTQQPSYAAAVNQGGRHDRGSGGAPPKHVAGTWNPRERHMLLATLAQAWGESSAPVDTTDQPLLRKVAMAPSKVHANDALRARTKQETQALLQYLNRTLELPHPPNFLKATLPLLQRAMVEQFHETHCEVTLTADILPRAKLRRSMTHNTLFAQLHAANSDSAAGKCMISRLLEDVKRLQFDGLHTLKFVFNSARVARLYTGLALRLNGTCIELEDTQDDATTGTYRLARLRRNYAVRAYGVDALGLAALLAALGRLDGVVVIDAERSRVESAEIVDNDYFLLRFTAEQCPDLLRGVTKLSVLGHVVTLHHHVIYQRMPCARCYAPYHTAGFCKANPAQLLRTQEKFQRTYKGPVPDYKVGTATQFLHTDEDSLTTFLATLHSELAGIAETQQDDAEPTTAANLVRAEAAAGPRPAQQRTTATEAMEVSQPGATKTLPTGTTDDGFTVVNRRQERPSKRNSTETPTTDAGPAETRQTGRKAPGGQASDVANGNSGGAQPPTAAAPTKTSAAVSNKKKTRGPAVTPKAQSKVKAYAKFKQAHALGRFAVLAEPEAEDQTVTDEEEEAEAPYAYPPDVADPLWTEMGEMVPDSAESETTYSQEGRANDASQPNPDADEIMLSAEGTVSSSYIGSSPPSQPRSWTTTQDLACPFSLQSDREALQPQMEVETQAQPECGGSLPVHGEGEQRHRQPEEPTLSQDGFSLEQTKVAPGMPQQLPTFLIPFQGSLTTVPQNGQCAYAALYATMTTTTETALHFTADVVKGINFMKKSIYTLMLANLANDVDCMVVDPRRELRRLYPSQPAPTDTAVATAALYAHYTQERARTVNSQIPTAFWAGPEVLRAMAQYLREPLFVLDVDQHNDTHVQRYYYRDYTLPNGDTHETGCGGSMDDVTATDMLAHYARLHVLPVLLVLKGHEGHFCGVHHGDIAVKWHAEGDLEFTHANCSEQPW
ncbi:hypothetical protein PR002_g24277 [Phytophthora rubi]|uniref:OTU domain-containing protein n=1 Tax=Phytophthora rubi TaxID=129364 RepID=A0A6A3IHE3_9STRA|nr:hypothetical protein PR002_g24277 [Phytophthora rubi]